MSPRAVFDITKVTSGEEADDPISGVTQGYHVGMSFQTLTQLRHLAERGHRHIAFALPADGAGAPPEYRLAWNPAHGRSHHRK